MRESVPVVVVLVLPPLERLARDDDDEVMVVDAVLPPERERVIEELNASSSELMAVTVNTTQVGRDSDCVCM